MTGLTETQDLSVPYMARSQAQAVARAQTDLDSLIGELQRDTGTQPQQQPQSSSAGNSILTRALKAPADVAVGAIETPAQAVGGALDAVGNAAKGLDHLGDWLNTHIADLDVQLPSSGINWVDRLASVAGNPLGAVGSLSGAIPKAKSVTGGFVREGADFLAGFIPALRASRAAGLGAKAAPIAAGAIAGGTVVDPDKKNLTAAIAENVPVPASIKPAVDLLATNPDDPEILNRARNVVENAGFGVLTEGVLQGVRTLAQARRAVAGEKAAADPMAAMRAQYGEVKPEDLSILGDPNKPAVSISKTAAAKLDAAAKATDGRVSIPSDTGGQVFINFARINEPEDVKSALDRMAGAFKGSIDEATRGVQTNEETARLADELGMSVDDLLQRRKGQPFNAEQSLAARRLWGASAQKLVEAAEKASSPNAGAVDQYAFRKMMATHYAIQAEVIGARTETARALQAWRIEAKGGVEQARAIQMMLDQNGGSGVTAELARRIAGLKNAGVSQDALNAAVRKGWGATTVDAVKEAFVQGLLWRPTTHIRNTVSNSIVAGQQVYERAAAAAISSLRGAEVDGVHGGEAAAMVYGLNSGLRDAFVMAAKALRTGERGGSIGKVELPTPNAISSDAFAGAANMNAAETEAFKETGLGKAIDFMGFANGIPGRLLTAEDEFFKTIGYRMELHAQALRTAAGEGHVGQDLANRVADIVANPPENIRIAAADAALYNTFQNPSGKVVNALMELRGASGLVGTVLLPFLKTPGNILSYTFERTPAAPLVARWRADVAAGGARRDLALARMATGSAILGTVLDLADTGLITGAGPTKPADKEALARTGWQPYSLRIGDKYVSYQADPVGMMFGFAATAAEKFKQAETSPEDLDEWQEAMGAATSVVGETVVDKTFFQSVANAVTAIQESRSGPGSVTNFLNQQAASAVPFSSALNTVKLFTDPVTRQVMNPYDAIAARMPILSQQLPARRDLWGEALKPDQVFGRTYDVMSPFPARATKESPIDAEMVRLGAGVDRIAVRSTFDGVPVNFRDYPNVYDRYVRLAGNEMEHPAWGIGAKQFLDELVSGKGPLSPVYDLFSDEGKAAMIRNTIDEFRQLARREILDNPEGDEGQRFVDYIQGKKDAAQEAKLPQ
jgi:hypothetical protein